MAQMWKKFSQFSHKACLGGWWVSSKCALRVARSGHNTVQKWQRALSENNTTKLSVAFWSTPLSLVVVVVVEESCCCIITPRKSINEAGFDWIRMLQMLLAASHGRSSCGNEERCDWKVEPGTKDSTGKICLKRASGKKPVTRRSQQGYQGAQWKILIIFGS